MKIGFYKHYFITKSNPNMIKEVASNLNTEDFIKDEANAYITFETKVTSNILLFIKTETICEVELNYDILEGALK